MTPRVSVVIPVYNGAAFLAEAVESVLVQTLADLELIVVDDGSTDRSAEILARVRDRRLQVIRNERNLGVSTALNRGILASRGTYVARLDADDVCDPERLAKQVVYLDANPHVAILGSAAHVTGASTPEGTVWPAPRTPLAVRFACLLRSPFVHSTVITRRAAFAEAPLLYDERLELAEDYDLWARALRRGLCGTNLSEPLVTYRIHGGQVTNTRRSTQLEIHDQVASRAIANEVPRHAVSPGDVTNMRRVFVGGGDGPRDPIAAISSYLDLFAAFASAHADHPELAGVKREVAATTARALVSSGRDRRIIGLATRILRAEPTLPARAALRARPRIMR